MQNRLLARLSPVDFEGLRPRLRVVELKRGDVVAENRRLLDKVYFPHSGILTCLVRMEDGSTIASGMIGNDGAIGASQALDHTLPFHTVTVQVQGHASIIDAAHVRAAAQASPRLLALLIRYENFFLAQVQLTTACNALHSIEQRICKWLVRMHDLAGPKLPLTHEFLAQMMGVRRTTVSGIAAKLRKEGMFTYQRGMMTVTRLDLIERRACECHHATRSLDAEMFGRFEGPSIDSDNPVPGVSA